MRRTQQGLAIANPIYREVVPRQFTSVQQEMWASQPQWYIGTDGRLSIEAVLERFFKFYRENGEMVTRRKTYTEAAQHLMKPPLHQFSPAERGALRDSTGRVLLIPDLFFSGA